MMSVISGLVASVPHSSTILFFLLAHELSLLTWFNGFFTLANVRMHDYS